MENELTEEEELQAAIMARIAERAEMRAAEKRLQNPTTTREEGSRPSLVDKLQPKFVPRELRAAVEEDGKQVAPVVPPTTKTTVDKPQRQATGSAASSNNVKPNQSSMSNGTRANNQQPTAAAAQRNGNGQAKQQFKSKPPGGSIHDRKTGKRFKFEWDASEDTLGDLAEDRTFAVPASRTVTTNTNGPDKLLRLADQRASRLAIASEAGFKDPNSKPLPEMTDRDWRIVRENFDIRVRGGPAPNPARSWDEMSLPDHLRRIVQKIGYTRPTPIQMQAVPIGLGASDVVGIAETGSGKTAAFVIPLLVRLHKEPWASKRNRCADDGPLALILGPTRELVNQIEEEVVKLGSLAPVPVRACAVIGGASAEEQGFKLREGCDVVVATPGRLIDLLASHVAVLNQCEYVVLDEADRMIDMGFEPQVNKVLEALVVPLDRRTTFLFSATMPPEVIRLAQRFMRANRIIIRIGDEESGKNKKIDQYAYVFTNEVAKDRELYRILATAEPPVIIFCNSKSNCDLLVRDLRAKGKRAVALHGGRNQDEREDNLRKFKEGVHDILVATDVAGRGLDVEGVTHVINYECPTTLDRYCHRIGRTGRAGKSGKASTFLMKGSDEPAVVNDIAGYMKQTGQTIPPDMMAMLSEFDLSGEAPIQE